MVLNWGKSMKLNSRMDAHLKSRGEIMFLFVYTIGYTYKDSLEFSILETQIQVIKLPAHFFILK